MTERLPATIARQVGGRSEISIRLARAADTDALRRLAGLADRRVPAAPVLIAASDGDVVAAVAPLTGEVLADPFRATADLVDLLRLRSAQLRAVAA